MTGNNTCLYLQRQLARISIMKTLSLKLDERIFSEAEKLTSQLKIVRNKYFNEAVNIYNLFNKRRLLKKQLLRESQIVSKDSMEVLSELERLSDEN
jgi:hypothetical protein